MRPLFFLFCVAALLQRGVQEGWAHNIHGQRERILILIYLLNAIGLTPGGSSTVQYAFTHKQYIEQHN